MNPAGGDGNFTHYHLTDHQFSTVALIDNAANLLERVTYDAYGHARHHWAGDITGDGAVGRADQTAMRDADRSSIGHVDYNVDADITRTGTVTNDDVTWTNTLNFKAALPKGVLSAPEVGNTIGYAGYVFNPEVQLYTVRFRHYDPGLGRWLERDPLGYVDGMSLYEYVASMSMVFVDPLGFGKNDPHGRPASPSLQQQVDDLEEQLKNATTRREKRSIENKIKNIKEKIRQMPKGETHSRTAKGKGGRGPRMGSFVGFLAIFGIYDEAQAMGSDLHGMFVQLRNASNYNDAYFIAVGIAAEVARVYGSAGIYMIDAILEAWQEYQDHKREQRQKGKSGGSGGSTQYESDWGPNGPPKQGIDTVNDCW